MMKEEKKISPLKQARLRLGLKQFDLSLKTGLSPTYICGYENGRWNPSPEHRAILSRALGVPIRKLFPE